MRLRSRLAVAAGKTVQFASRRLKLGGGTNLPGRIARRIAPRMLHEQMQRLSHGAILVSGTNGKTTTARMLATILTQAGQPTLHNRAGANLITGLTATALDLGVGVGGATSYTHALFEVDEAHVPAALLETEPRVVLLLNLFRDQLDRYGEVDTLAERWRSALASLPPSTTIVLNADDPAVAFLGHDVQAQVLYYGLEDQRHGNDALRHAADSIFCRRCGTPYVYAPAFYGHIGLYHCPACNHTRPVPDIRLEHLELHGVHGSTLRVVVYERTGVQAVEIDLPLPGLYNALNGLAALAAAVALGYGLSTIRSALQSFSAAFGRIERFEFAGHPTLMVLVKNPIGASESVRMLVSGASEPLDLMIAINDKIADGTDVSWLWDADWEALQGHVRSVITTGTRAADMAVRLKYAGIAPEQIQVEPQLDQALKLVQKQLSPTAPLTILPTYTAMLELREIFVEQGILQPFWES